MKAFRLGLMLLMIGGWAGLQAATFPDKPANDSFYVDLGGLITLEDGKGINETAAKLLQEEAVPIIVVTIPSLASFQAGDSTIEKYAGELFDHWGIGSQDRNYGILLLVSLADRKARIELGKGWAGAHDADAKQIMDGTLIPNFKRGDFSGGIRAGVNALSNMARGLELPKPEGGHFGGAGGQPAPPWALPAMIVGVILVIGVIISLFKSGRSGWGWALLAALGIFLFFVLRAAASSSGGGSGGSFGGGSSGGGGASGSW